jgi:hypothetical protein
MKKSPHHVMEVSASAQPGEVVEAIMRSGQQRERDSSQRFYPLLIKGALVFTIALALVLYFSEEAYTITKGAGGRCGGRCFCGGDGWRRAGAAAGAARPWRRAGGAGTADTSPDPAAGPSLSRADLHAYSINYIQGLEAVQIRKYFGSGWHVTEGDPEVLGLVNATAAANATEAARLLRP